MTTKTEYVLWGFHPAYANGEWFKLSGSTRISELRHEQAFRAREGFKTKIYARGVAP